MTQNTETQNISSKIEKYKSNHDPKLKNTMSVPEMRRLLGLKKTESYWLVHKNYFETKMIDGKMRVESVYAVWKEENLETIIVEHVRRIPIAVFESWYENQIMYQKADRMPTLMDMEADYILLQDAAELLGITREKLSAITRMSRFKEEFEIRVFENKKWISKKSFQQFLNAQSLYQVKKRPEKKRTVDSKLLETKEYISRQEAAALAGVTSTTITKWAQLERFSSAGTGRVFRVHRKEFLEWLKEYQEGER